MSGDGRSKDLRHSVCENYRYLTWLLRISCVVGVGEICVHAESVHRLQVSDLIIPSEKQKVIIHNMDKHHILQKKARYFP